MADIWDVVIVGSGNAALTAGIAASEKGAKVLIVEKADQDMSGGNTKYTAGAMRFAYENSDALIPLLAHPDDERVARSDFGSYTQEKFKTDLLGFNGLHWPPKTKVLDCLIWSLQPSRDWVAPSNMMRNSLI